MTKYEDNGIVTIVTSEKIIIEVTIKGAVNAFNLNPNNPDESKIRRGKQKEFANYLARAMVEIEDPDTGNNPVMDMFDRIFEEILESDEDFVKYGEEE